MYFVLYSLLVILILYALIAFVWQTVERLVLGYTVPLAIDDIIALCLAAALYFNGLQSGLF